MVDVAIPDGDGKILVFFFGRCRYMDISIQERKRFSVVVLKISPLSF